MNRRNERVARLVQQTIGEIILRRISDPRIDPAKVSVTRVEVSEDTTRAKVFCSAMGTEAEQRNVLRALQHAAGRIQEMMMQQISLRHTPVLHFVPDERFKKTLTTLALIQGAMDEIREQEASPATPRSSPPTRSERRRPGGSERMKKATEYGLKIKRMLPSLKKRFIAPPPEDLQPLEVFVVGVLREGSTLPTALAALRLMQEEFVDFNEIRVAPPKDIMDMLANDMPDLRAKAEQITAGLNRIFDHENRLDFEHAADMGKRDLQTHLRESLGFSSFVEAYLLLYLFGHRAMPVDARLVDRLKADGLVHPESTVDDVRVLLERVVYPKAQAEAFEMLAQYAQQPIKIAKKKAKAKRAGKAAAKKETKAGKKAAPKTAAQESSRATTKKAGPKKASKAAAKAKKRTGKTATKLAKKAKKAKEARK